MKSCRECMHHLVCAIYAPNFNDILANGENCSEFRSEPNEASHIVKEIFDEIFSYTFYNYGRLIIDHNTLVILKDKLQMKYTK